MPVRVGRHHPVDLGVVSLARAKARTRVRFDQACAVDEVETLGREPRDEQFSIVVVDKIPVAIRVGEVYSRPVSAKFMC